MIKLYRIVIFLMLWMFFHPGFVKSQHADTLEKSILWEISHPEMKNSSYLFGTIHIIPQKDYFFFEYMEEKFKKTDLLVLETNIDLPLAKKIELAKAVLMPEGKTLSDYMNEEDFNRFISYLEDSLGISESKHKKYVRIKPIFLPGLILNDYYKKVEAYEMNLTKLAKKKNMDIFSLESIEFQLNMLDSIPIDDQVSIMLSDRMELIGSYEKMIEAYVAQDITKLNEIMDLDTTFMAYERVILSGRNIEWVEKIDSLVWEKPVFIAVGAGHLPGTNGLINLLRKKGYQVSPCLD